MEDFINTNSIKAIRIILEMLRKYRLKAIFFITGHMAEKLSNFPEILELLKIHEIGYHSSSHSVRPTIPEYTDVEDYYEAYLISLERETAHINPLTGKMEGKGGIDSVRDLFHPKKITAYRAPGNSWSPPHLEALVDLGIKFDFSSSITSTPVHYRGITFYPNTFTQHWKGGLSDYQSLLYATLKYNVSVFDLHPTLYVNQNMWDSTYYEGNPRTLLKTPEIPLKEVRSLFVRLELLLKQINLLRNAKLIEVNPALSTPARDLVMSENDVQKCYEASIRWPEIFFNYKPKFIRAHFYKFFEQTLR